MGFKVRYFPERSTTFVWVRATFGEVRKTFGRVILFNLIEGAYKGVLDKKNFLNKNNYIGEATGAYKMNDFVKQLIKDLLNPQEIILSNIDYVSLRKKILVLDNKSIRTSFLS